MKPTPRPIQPKRASSALLALALSVVALAGGASATATDRHHGRDRTRVYELEPSIYGNPEGIAFDKHTRAFFVGSTGLGAPAGGGAIYRGTLDQKTVELFIPGQPGAEAAGMKVFDGKLYVAGGFSQRVTVYDVGTGTPLAMFEIPDAGMLNDLVVTRTGDVFITDSFVPVLWHITAAQVAIAVGGGLPDMPAAIPVTGPHSPINWVDGDFNLNGIVAINGGQSLIVIQSAIGTGRLFRIDLPRTTPNGRVIRELEIVEIELAAELYGDGLLLDKDHLVVATFAPTFSLTFIRLDHRAERGRIVDIREDPALRGPSTVARAGNSYLVVNFDIETSTVPFTVTRLPRIEDDGDNED